MSLSRNYVALSSETRAICSKFWGSERDRCHGCPIMNACNAPVYPLTRDTVNAHSSQLNKAAEAYSFDAKSYGLEAKG